MGVLVGGTPDFGHGFFEGLFEAALGHRLHQKRGHAEAHGLLGVFEHIVGGDHDHLPRKTQVPQPGEAGEAVAAGKPQVQQHQLGMKFHGPGLEFRRRDGRLHLKLPGQRLGHLFQGLPLQILVLHDQQTNAHDDSLSLLMRTFTDVP